MVAAMSSELVQGRAASWMTTISAAAERACNPFQTESCRSGPPATRRKGFVNLLVFASSMNAPCNPSRTTMTISSTQRVSSNVRQVCATTGEPFNSRNSLSRFGPIRMPLPAATMMAETILPSLKSKGQSLKAENV